MQIFNQRKSERIYVFLSKSLKEDLIKFKESSGMCWDALIFHLSTTIEAPDSYQSNYHPRYKGKRDKLFNIYISPLTLRRFNQMNSAFNKIVECLDYLMFEQSRKTPFDGQPPNPLFSNV